jgi:exopolyphosphatase/guanosine-5'-triphosphate,3'-diphosphate pyrophosphatase
VKRASIDIGSNSVLLLACDFSDKIEKELLNLSFITSLGKNLDKTKMFEVESMKATYDALENYKQELKKININPEDVTVTATEASRVATNAAEFFKKIKNELGFNIQTISGIQEAHYTAIGVVSALENENDEVIVMDMGGASTEFIKIKRNPFKIISSISLPVGSVRATDWKKENSFTTHMKELLENKIDLYQTNNLICVAGSMTSLASMFLGKKVFNDKEIDGLKISFNEFKKFEEELRVTNTEELLLNFPFLGKRAPMVSAGASVARIFGEQLKIQTMQISTRGLRYGVLISGGINE